MTTTTPLLIVAEVADALRVRPSTVRRMVKARVLRGVKVGREWRFDPDDVAAYLADGENRPPSRRRRARRR